MLLVWLEEVAHTALVLHRGLRRGLLLVCHFVGLCSINWSVGCTVGCVDDNEFLDSVREIKQLTAIEKWESNFRQRKSSPSVCSLSSSSLIFLHQESSLASPLQRSTGAANRGARWS
jgi:hypothetical protein